MCPALAPTMRSPPAAVYPSNVASKPWAGSTSPMSSCWRPSVQSARVDELQTGPNVEPAAKGGVLMHPLPETPQRRLRQCPLPMAAFRRSGPRGCE
jgi:hypothetical protein